jgi:predicted TIM-barrel fold metal-dependent hydrolase
MFIIDSHAHIYPDKIATKAAAGIGRFYGLPMRHDGTVGSLLASGQKAGISKYVVQSVATSPEQVPKINEFIAQAAAAHEEFIGFAAMHQDTADPEAALDHSERLGLRGVKLHPDLQGFVFDDPKMDRLYAAMEGRLPLLLHAGDNRKDFSGPRRIAAVLDRFPKLDVICAHFGGYFEWDEAARILAGRRLWVDTSSSLPFIGPERGRELVEVFGAERVVFGTDYPVWDAEEELARFYAMNLPNEQLEMILYKNISDLLSKYREG